MPLIGVSGVTNSWRTDNTLTPSDSSKSYNLTATMPKGLLLRNGPAISGFCEFDFR
jgi:hypothetical protein